MDINLRIKELRSQKKMTQLEFSSLFGVDNSQFSKIEGGKLQPTLSLLMEISSKLDVSADWLLTGKGEMLVRENSNLAQGPLEGFPLVSPRAVAGFSNVDFRIEEQDIQARYVVPKFKHKQVDFMIEIEGSSMYPKYNSGDVIACKIINERHFIQWNKTHVVATKDQGIIVKRIKPSERENCLCMVSDNKDYPAFDVPMDEIGGVAMVVGVIRLE